MLEPLNDVQINTLHTALAPALIGNLTGGHIDEDRRVYDAYDFMEIIASDKVLAGIVEGRVPRELGIALIHITENYETKEIR